MSRRFDARDRLTLTLFGAGMLHSALIFGIGFSFEAHPDHALPSLDVILVQTRSSEAPEQADYLAQASQKGGGDSDERNRPREAFASQVPKPEPGIAPREMRSGAPARQPEQVEREALLTQRLASAVVVPDDTRMPTPARPMPPDSAELVQRRLEMARLAAEINRDSQAYAKRPKRKFITANTREYEFAAYMHGWAAKVERVGNLNYPPEARRRSLYGDLVLTVAVRRDGSILSIDVIKSSGQPVLDDAATQIVRMAAPFASIPHGKEDIDELHITRTWRFLPGNVLRSQ